LTNLFSERKPFNSVKQANASRLWLVSLGGVFALWPADPLSPSSTGAPALPNAVQTPEKNTRTRIGPHPEPKTIRQDRFERRGCKGIALFLLTGRARAIAGPHGKEGITQRPSLTLGVSVTSVIYCPSF